MKEFIERAVKFEDARGISLLSRAVVIVKKVVLLPHLHQKQIRLVM
jgi:hypothetical protein